MTPATTTENKAWSASDEVLRTHLDYWKKQLGGPLAALQLPLDKPRPKARTARGDVHPFRLAPELKTALDNLGQREGATLFMTLLAGFKTLLHLYSGQDEVLVGTVAADGPPSEIEGMNGVLANTLVLRSDLSDNLPFDELLRRVRATTLEARAHQDLPFDRLVEAIRPGHDPNQTPLFQVMFVFQPEPSGPMPGTGSVWALDQLPGEAILCDLTLTITVEDEGLHGALAYNADLFEPVTMARMADHFRTLLEVVAANPGLRPSQVPLLTPSEQHQLLVEWNNTQAPYPTDQCIHQLFEAQAARTPDRPAMAFDTQQLTYGDLNRRANQLARHLQGLGVGPDVLVGLCVERSLDMVVGLLGILKAGGAYVPLDPTYPKDRLGHMVEDSRMPVLLTQPHLLDRLPEHRARVVCLDPSLWRELADLSADNPASLVTADNVVYVIYTSGSTGKPKGVLVPHRALVNYTEAASAAYEIQAEDRVLQFASISFDASAEEIYPPLTRGGRLVLRTASMLDSVAQFLAKCQEWGITMLDLPTAYWHEITAVLQAQSLTLPPGVRLVVIGGEKALSERLLVWRRQVDPRVRLVNTYGPTETTIVATMCDIAGPRAVDSEGREVPIGRPVANYQVYVLSRDLQPVPVGVPGELHIGGAGLARGYLNRPEVTTEKFVPNPFGADGSRLYKTGDLVRYRSDGQLEFLGRVDFQVKVRGFRIELGEIETMIGQHPKVRDTVVVARPDEYGQQMLVAYVVPRDGVKADAPQANGALDLADLRHFLRTKLPGYMVPAHLVPLESLPLTPNGKIDRRALPAPDHARLDRGGEYTPPRTATEETLAGFWTEVLKIPRIGIDEDFFSLGGHSLNATQVVSRICQHFQVDLPVQALFASPTIAGLAQTLQDAAATRTRAPAITPAAGDRTRLPASFAQQRLWLLDQLIKNRDVYNICESVRLQGVVDVPTLHHALEELALRHESLRTTFASDNGQPVQVIAVSQPVDLPLIDLSGRPAAEREAEVQRVILAEGRQAFDLSKAPLWRAKFLRLGPEEHLLLLTLHHIIADGWSMAVFYRDLAALYESLADEGPAALPALAVQYADFGLWQRDWLQGEVLQNQVDYWKQRLASPLATLELPIAKTRPPMQTFNGAIQAFDLSPSLTQAVAELSRRQGVTPFMTLLAAFKTLLHRYSGQDDLLVGTPVANRNRPETEEIIGFFVNTLVMRTDLSGDPTFLELLARVRDGALEAFARQDVPFERLVEELRPPRDTSRNPLFQVLFNYLQEGSQALAVNGATWTTRSLHNGTSKFDLTLFLEEGPDGLHSYFEYNTDLFEPAAIERMAGHLRTLLQGIVANPQDRLSQLPLLTEPERHQLLVEWNNTQADYPRDRCMYQLFEEQAARTPDQPAVLFEKQQVTYGELNARANQLARHLRTLGVGPDVPVGLCVDRSIDMVLGGLGILKAGGAYVPLDPAFPSDRLAFYVEDSRMPVLVTQQRLADRIPGHGARVVLIDGDWKTITQQSTDNPPPTATSDTMVYMIFTSGSTGKPKGVQIPHKALTNFLNSMRRQPGLTEHDVLLSVTTMSFDIHALELWLPLTVGARVAVVSRDDGSDGYRLLQRLNQFRATVLQATPATWRLLLAAAWQGSPQLKALCGGEPMTVELANQLLPRVGSLWNMYGPTETTVWSTLYPVPSASGAIPIGRPIDNTSVYVLDRHLNPVPIGVAGELLIGGDGVARGYLNRPELTAEKFVPDPFRPVAGARMYKTGDLARYWPDGNLECLGRLDHQVKIRGFRIELGEIETILSQHPAVRSAVVVARKDESGADHLVAYLIPLAGQDATSDALRGFLKTKLPDYMVPSYFVPLESFPLTPNGKIDRKALPAPEGSRAEQPRTVVAPRNEEEKDVAAIWEEVLKVRPIGVTDNFFDLGGHSFLAAVLIAQIRQKMGHTLPLSSLFAAPTVEKLTAVLMHNLEAGTDSSIVPLHEEGTYPPLFMIAGVGGHVFTFHKFARLLGPEQPVYGVKAIGVEGTQKALDRIEEIAAQYVKEITALRPTGPYLLAGYSIGAVVALELALQLEAQGQKVGLLVAFDALSPGYPPKLPLARRVLIHLSNLIRGPDRTKYLRQRYGQLKARTRQALGLGYYNAPAIEGVGDLPQTALKEVWAAMVTAVDRYLPQQQWDGKMLLFKAQQGFQWAATVMDDPLLGWGQWVTGGVEEHAVPGSHMDMFNEQNINLVAEKLKDCILRSVKPVP